MSSQPHERPLFASDDYASKRWLDFSKIPEEVWPTGFSILEQRGDFLFYRVADAARGISPKQNSIFRRLANLSNFPDSPCNMTVLVVTGIPESTKRSWAVYDHMTEYGKPVELKPITTAEIQGFISEWFFSRKGGR